MARDYTIATKAQIKTVERLKELDKEIANTRYLYDQKVKAGDKKNARKNILPELNELIFEREELRNKIAENHDRAAEALLSVFAGCDLLDELADHLSDTLDECTEGLQEEQGRSFAKLLHKSCEELNSVVRMIDMMGNLDLSVTYADFAETLTGKIKELMHDEITRFMRTKKGRAYF